ncbi:MAG: hypothetical protein OEL86_05850 [Sulfuritalea sp.]|nr:hypothetical protein [Sulfuritalea sp.]
MQNIWGVLIVAIPICIAMLSLRNYRWILLLFFFYGSLHYSFSLPAIFLTQERATPTAISFFCGVLVWVLAIGLFLAYLPSGTLSRTLSLEKNFQVLLFIGIALVSVLGVTFPLQASSSELAQTFKGPILSSTTWIGAYVFSVGIGKTRFQADVQSRDSIARLLMILALWVGVVAVAEVSLGVAYAREVMPTTVLSRASGPMYNPNVLGFWAAYSTIAVCIFFCEEILSRRRMFVLIPILGLVSLLSGSRSSFVVGLVSAMVLLLGLAVVSAPHARRVGVVLIAWLASCTGILGCAYGLAEWFGVNSYLTDSLVRNGFRYILAFGAIFRYLTFRLTGLTPHSREGLTVADLDSLEGRIGQVFDLEPTTTVDNEFLSWVAIGGWAAFTLYIGLWAILMIEMAASLRKYRNRFSLYSLVIVIGLGLSGMSMRITQMLPTAIFSAIALAFALYWHRRSREVGFDVRAVQ